MNLVWCPVDVHYRYVTGWVNTFSMNLEPLNDLVLKLYKLYGSLHVIQA